MIYTIVGTGNMAYFLGKRLHATGALCVGVYGRNTERAKTLAGMLDAPTLTSLQHLPSDANCCILAVSDGAIKEISTALSLTETVMIHTSGATSLEAIEQPHKACLWPIFSIHKQNDVEHREIPIICDSNTEKAQAAVLKLARSISDNVQEAAYEKRLQLHLVAAMGNNFTNHLLAICQRYCEEKQLSFDLFKPILQQTFERLNTISPFLSQTGAARRNDTQTMQMHLSLLQEHPLWAQLYRDFSNSIKDMYSTIGE